MDVGADEVGNVALEALVPLDRTILAGAESRWEALIRNDSPRVLAGAKAVLRVDDQPTEVTLPEIAPRQTARVPLTVQFPGSGPHDLSLQLPDDELPGDNRRWAAVPVKDSLLIRLVDGEPSSEPFGSEVDYLAAPLSIGVGDGRGLARRGRPGGRLPLPPPRSRRRARAGQRRGADARAGRPARPASSAAGWA